MPPPATRAPRGTSRPASLRVRSVSSESSPCVDLDSRGLEQQLGLALVQPEVRHADLVHQTVCPPAGERQRGIFSAGDRDLRAGRNVIEQRRQHVQAGGIGNGVQIIEHHAPAGARDRPVRARPAGRGSPRWILPGPTTRRRASGGTGSTLWIAAAMYRSNTTASSSRASSATHANGRESASAHCARSVVLPYPAGATTLTNGTVDVQSRAITSAFATVPGLASGAASLISKTSNGASREGHARPTLRGSKRPEITLLV